MSAPWWRGIPPAVARVSCDGREHRLRWAEGKLLAPDHPDLEGEQILSVLGGQSYACLDVLDAWAGHADDLRVLVLASRGPADPVLVRSEDGSPPGRPRRVRPSAMTTSRVLGSRSGMYSGVLRSRGGMYAGHSWERDATLGRLLTLGGPMQTRLAATVVAAWRERMPGGAASADAASASAAVAEAAGPALHAALYGRAVATLRAWTGQPDLRVALTMIPESASPALARDGGGLAAELPLGWINEVWARGLGTCWDRFCLAAGPAGDGWELSTVGPGLGTPEPIMISGSAVG